MAQKLRFLFPLLLTMLVASLSGCSGLTLTSETPAEGATEEAVPTAQLAPIVEEVKEPNYCLDCHTDKDQLISTAKPEEEVVSENEGEG